jgi:fumarylpyruvate hydrolase
VLGDWVPLPASSPPSAYLDLPFELDLAGRRNVQTGAGAEMMVLPEEALRHVDSLMEVCPGDFFFTGTPAGVGPVLPGQDAEVRLLEKEKDTEGEGGAAKALVRYRVRFE